MKTVYRILSITILFFLVLITQLSANNKNEIISKNMTSLLGSASEGTEFFLTFHPCWEEVSNPQNKIFIYVTSSYKTKVTLEIPGKTITKQKECPSNGVIVFELTAAEAQCYEKTAIQEPSSILEYPGYGIIIRSEEPVVCYGLNTSLTTSEGFMAIPKSSLGTQYIVSSYNSAIQEDSGQFLTSYTSIIGAYPDTQVEITIGGSKNNYTEKPSNFRPGSIKTITLQKGDVYLIGVKGNFNDLTGTIINATKPVSVISGSYATNVPKELGYAGYLIEQDIPVSAWGTQYHVIPVYGRQKASIIRVLASKPNTTVYLNGNELAVIQTAGGEEGKGYIESRAQAEGSTELNPVTISANNRISVTQYNTGVEDDNVPSAPSQLALTPVGQYQNDISWTIPNNLGAAIYKKNYVNICYLTEDLFKIPDDILFGQSDGTTIEWKKLANITAPGKVLFDDKLPEGQFWRATTVELFNPAFVYYLKGNNKMTVYCYGTSDAGVYAYPTISNYNDISKLDIYKPSIEYTVDCTGFISGKITDEPKDNPTLRTNLREVKLIKAQSYNVTEFDENDDELISGITNKWDFSLDVIDKNLKAKVVIYVSDCAGNDSNYVIEYYPVKFTMDKPFYNFGGNYVDAPAKTITCELTNESEIPILLDSIYLKSNYKKSNSKFAGFTINNKIYKENGGTLPELTLNPGDKFSFNVTFNPSSVRDDFIAGKNEFMDSIGIKANWSEDSFEYCFEKYIAGTTANVTFLDTLAPTVTFTPCCCGHTAIGNVTDEPANDPANRSNLARISLDNKKSFNCGKVKYDETAFIPGTTSSIDWEVSTIVTEADAKAVILFADRAGNETEVTIDLIKTKISFDSKIYDYGKVNPNDNTKLKKLIIKNLSNKDIVLDSIMLLSNDIARGWPKSGFIVDPAAYKANGGQLPNLLMKPNDEYEFNVIFDPQSIQDQIAGGKTGFKDSVGIKANRNSELNLYCFNEYKASVIAEISSVGVDDLKESYGITDISPNPVNSSSVNIKYELPYDCNVVLSLYNSTGMLISNLLNVYKTTGSQSLTVPVSGLAAGLYFIEFKAGDLVGHKSFVIVK